MFRNMTAACLLALMSLFAIGSAGAQTAPASGGAFLDGMQSSVIQSIGAQDRTVEITVADSILTVTRVNSNMNASSHEGRNSEATAIARVVSKAMGADATSADVHTIRVEYLTRDSANANGEVIDTIEFRKNANGEFEIHMT